MTFFMRLITQTACVVSALARTHASILGAKLLLLMKGETFETCLYSVTLLSMRLTSKRCKAVTRENAFQRFRNLCQRFGVVICRLNMF